MTEYSLAVTEKSRLFNGFRYECRAFLPALQAETVFHLYLPPMCGQGYRVPVLLWLADGGGGAADFSARSGVQRFAAQWGLAVLVPEVSAWYGRDGVNVCLAEELPGLVGRYFLTDGAYSLGGHGAGAVQALRLAAAGRRDYAAVSLFSPFAWADGQAAAETRLSAAFSDGIGLPETALRQKILCDAADADGLPEGAADMQRKWAADRADGLLLRTRPAYAPNADLIASFIDSHVEFHADALGL